MRSFLHFSVAFSSVHLIVCHTFRWIMITSAGHALPAGFNVMQFATYTLIIAQRPRSSADVQPPPPPPSTFANNYANWGYGLNAVSSVRIGLIYDSCDVAVNGLAAMSSKNGFVYNPCLILNAYIRQRPYLCLLAQNHSSRMPKCSVDAEQV